MVDKVIEYLKNEWLQLTAKRKVDPQLAENYFIHLIAAYSETHRAYHRPEHLQHLIILLHEACVKDEAVFWASFYHDYVYLPGRNDNELKSAKVAMMQLRVLGVEDKLIERIYSLILATHDHSADINDYDAAFFLDADMAILGVEPKAYEDYTNAVRKEFIRIPTFLFKRGRKIFLKKLLDKKRIFISDWFYERFEKSAIRNITWEVNQL